MTYKALVKELEQSVESLEEEIEHTKYVELSETEKKVLKKINDGYSTGEIADMMDISPSRVSQIKRKLKETTLL